MPFKFDSDHLRISSKNDRRVKIPKTEYPTILNMHKKGDAIRAIARHYNVNKRLIQFILYPERQAKCYKARLERGGSKQYYNKEKWRLVMRGHRRYKRSLYLEGKLLKPKMI